MVEITLVIGAVVIVVYLAIWALMAMNSVIDIEQEQEDKERNSK